MIYRLHKSMSRRLYCVSMFSLFLTIVKQIRSWGLRMFGEIAINCNKFWNQLNLEIIRRRTFNTIASCRQTNTDLNWFGKEWQCYCFHLMTENQWDQMVKFKSSSKSNSKTLCVSTTWRKPFKANVQTTPWRRVRRCLQYDCN